MRASAGTATNPAALDYRLYHWINDLVRSHLWLGERAATLESWSIPLFAVATVGLWFLARPGGGAKWKLACSSALASAGLALAANQAIALLWQRPRPYAAHPEALLLGARSPDPSFPSDHATAAFAIAVAVFSFDRVAGSLFLAAATTIAVGRVVTGVHYPADVAAGALMGTMAAVLVTRAGRKPLETIVRLAGRLTDPALARIWRLAPAARQDP